MRVAEIRRVGYLDAMTWIDENPFCPHVKESFSGKQALRGRGFDSEAGNGSP